MKIYLSKFANFLEIKTFGRIRDSETLNRRSRIYLRYLRHDRAPLIESIAQGIENIFQHQTNAFKINFSFSFILQHRETREFRYHYTSNNNQLLNSSKLIRNHQDLNNLLDFLASQDFPSHLKDQRPSTKWVIERIVSLRIHLVMTTYTLGNPPKLPYYIKNNRFIIGLEKMNIPEHTRTISVSFVVWLLESTNSLAITVIKKLKNFFKIIANTLKSILKILKVLN